jgi:hypothetical protein
MKEETDHLKAQIQDINEENYNLNKEINELKVSSMREI